MTRPKSPTLHTTQRMKLRDDLEVMSADQAMKEQGNNTTGFKARPLNKRIFETAFKPSKTEKKVIAFDEFKLSKSNGKLAKRSLFEYLKDKENNGTGFRARSFSKNKFEQQLQCPKTEVKPKRMTAFSPFKFRTEERLRLKSNEREDSSQYSNSQCYFHAREMPKYNFFELKHEPQRKVLFQEFQLATRNRSRSRVMSQMSDHTESVSNVFRALPMPNFSELFRNQQKSVEKSKVEPEPF